MVLIVFGHQSKFLKWDVRGQSFMQIQLQNLCIAIHNALHNEIACIKYTSIIKFME